MKNKIIDIKDKILKNPAEDKKLVFEGIRVREIIYKITCHKKGLKYLKIRDNISLYY